MAGLHPAPATGGEKQGEALGAPRMWLPITPSFRQCPPRPALRVEQDQAQVIGPAFLDRVAVILRDSSFLDGHRQQLPVGNNLQDATPRHLRHADVEPA